MLAKDADPCLDANMMGSASVGQAHCFEEGPREWWGRLGKQPFFATTIGKMQQQLTELAEEVHVLREDADDLQVNVAELQEEAELAAVERQELRESVKCSASAEFGNEDGSASKDDGGVDCDSAVEDDTYANRSICNWKDLFSIL